MHRLAFALLTLPACYAETTSPSTDFDDDIATLRFEIDAMVGAAPQGAMSSGVVDAEAWDLLRVNVEALYASAPREVVLPRDEDDIGMLADPGAEDYDVDALLELADVHRDSPESDDDLLFHVLFVDGYYSADGAQQPDVLGVSIGDTGVIAMFSPVIGDGPLSRFIEQTTLVHEVGHTVGLVDNGVDMVDEHLDDAHGHHCDNPDCVMYWLNEGPEDLRTYVQQYVTGGDAVLFDDACLSDATAAAGG
ncbi:MAG: hypothetical protein IAG13_24535 [Deltaproteobacteria bacterium]|nr:hypothetical protein [Nannocystaceae bacterium]